MSNILDKIIADKKNIVENYKNDISTKVHKWITWNGRTGFSSSDFL